MKQRTKITLQSLFNILLFGVVILAVADIKQPNSPAPINHTEPVIKPIVTKPNPKNTTSPVTLASKPIAPSTTPTSNSPKYDAIKDSVQKEYAYHMFTAPNDPQYPTNWTLAKVNAPAAWDITTGNGQTIVAVIDSGFALGHEDLENRWATNNNEVGTTKAGESCWTGTPQAKQSNNCDDDNNGYVDDWRGWSFVYNDNNPQTGRTNPIGDGTQHATQVSGIVGAESNNGIGVTSINWNTKIMPLQVLDDEGTGYTSAVTSAIYYAVDEGVSVINMSLGTYSNDPALRTAITYATANNVVVVAASGNCGDGGIGCVGVPVDTIAYPAAYPEVIAVGATTQSDQRAGFSSFGAGLDVSAPGYAVSSSTSWSVDNPTSLYSDSLYGTSFASPQVASLAALIKSIRPSTSVADITAIIDATATKPNVMGNLFYSNQFGHGIINAGTALSIASMLNNSPVSAPTLLQAGSSQSEHSTPVTTTIGSGCQLSNGVCTIQFTDSSGYRRYLPYSILSSGSIGWSWSSDSLSSDNWEIRARSGDNISTTPYYLLKKG
ncbi:MAG: S8 family serine peptidase [Candidatus Saccharimonadales bacterium]